MSFKTEFLQLVESISNAGVNFRTLLAGLIGSIVAVQYGGKSSLFIKLYAQLKQLLIPLKKHERWI
jgi:hypothetical protein